MSSVKTRKLDISTILAVVRAQNQSGSIDQWVLNEATQDIYNNNNSGQVAINKDTADYTLDVNGSFKSTIIVDKNNSTGISGQFLSTTGGELEWKAGSGGTIVTDSTAFAASSMLAKNTSSNVFATTNATLTGTGAISCLSVNTTSDQNLKTEIEPLTSNYQEDLIKNLKPIMYRFKHDLENKRLGFIAQEVESLLNEKCALIGNENNIMSLNYLELISPIISVLQNILNRLDKLEKINNN